MSYLLEILGRAITIDTTDLIWHWLNAAKLLKDESQAGLYHQLNKAIELIGDQKFEAATEQLRMYLLGNPSCTYGRLAVAAVLLHNNQLSEAINELNSVYMRQPNNTMALYALGYCYERLGRQPEAVEFYQDCLKFKSYLQLPAQRLAAIYFKNGQPEKTIEQYEILKNEYPDDVSTLLTLGHLYVKTSRYVQAIETFNTAILIHPDNFHSQNDEIDQLIAEGQFHDALDRLGDLLQEQDNRPDLLVKYADVLRLLGAGSDAVTQYEEALRMCPDFLEATIKLGTQYLQMHQARMAARQFNAAVEINDNIVDAYIGLATSQKLANLESDAYGTLSLAAAIQPNSSLLFAETAALQFQAGLMDNVTFDSEDYLSDPTNAVVAAHYQQINERPQNPDLRYRLGVLLMSAGNIPEAVKSFQVALEINPNFSRARSKLALGLFEMDRKSEAMDLLTRNDFLDKDTLDLHYQVALLYCDKVKFASSLMNLERHLENNFAHPEASVNISIVLQNLGLLDRVTAMWDNLSDTTDHAINADYPFPM
jgi:tetratricopeptide (TPR) repeat protein